MCAQRFSTTDVARDVVLSVHSLVLVPHFTCSSGYDEVGYEPNLHYVQVCRLPIGSAYRFLFQAELQSFEVSLNELEQFMAMAVAMRITAIKAFDL